MSEFVNLSRDGFLKTGALAGGGLLLGFNWSSRANGEEPTTSPASSRTPFTPNAFVRIGSDDSVTVIANHSEMGQGPYTTLAMILADELDADWSRVKVESAPAAPEYNHSVYGMQMTGGSTSTWSEYERFRKAGATARAMLVAAAADAWKVDAASCTTENGQVVHAASNRRMSYGKLVDKAAELKPPQDVKLKETKDFKLIGRAVKRLDTPAKVNGTAQFGIDVNLPGMLVAVVERSPVFGGKVKSFNADKAKAIKGVRHIVQIDRGVAVVADGYWPAKLGRDALEVSWDEGPQANLDSVTQGQEYAELAKQPGAVAHKVGDAAAVLEKAKLIEAVYELPFLAHATMEPLNAVADVRADSCEVWTGTQFQTIDHAVAAKDSGLKPEQVKVYTTFLGGGFGRRAVPDGHFVSEAVQLSKKLKTPIKVVWSREDDMRGGYYRPRALHAISAATDDKGTPTGWQHRIVCPSFIVGTPFEAVMVKNGVDDTAVEGANEIPYDVANMLVDWTMAPGGVPTLWWRSVGHSHTAFAVESFIDELAHAAKQDPYQYRLSLLGKQPRHKRLLDMLADRAGWGKPLPAGQGRGMAIHMSFGSLIAQVIEASVDEGGKPRVHRVVVGVDCGPVVYPDGVRAQMESCVAFGLSAALYGEITFEKGRVKQRNFHDYPVLRMHEMPKVEVHILPSQEKMGGIGEPGVPPVAPALCNALFAATGKRIRSLPIRVGVFKDVSESKES